MDLSRLLEDTHECDLFDVERSSLDTYVELVPGKCWNVCEGSCRIEKGILRGALRS